MIKPSLTLASQTFRVKLGSHWSEKDGFVEGADLSADAVDADEDAEMEE